MEDVVSNATSEFDDEVTQSYDGESLLRSEFDSDASSVEDYLQSWPPTVNRKSSLAETIAKQEEEEALIYTPILAKPEVHFRPTSPGASGEGSAPGSSASQARPSTRARDPPPSREADGRAPTSQGGRRPRPPTTEAGPHPPTTEALSRPATSDVMPIPPSPARVRTPDLTPDLTSDFADTPFAALQPPPARSRTPQSRRNWGALEESLSVPLVGSSPPRDGGRSPYMLHMVGSFEVIRPHTSATEVITRQSRSPAARRPYGAPERLVDTLLPRAKTSHEVRNEKSADELEKARPYTVAQQRRMKCIDFLQRANKIELRGALMRSRRLRELYTKHYRDNLNKSDKKPRGSKAALRLHYLRHLSDMEQDHPLEVPADFVDEYAQMHEAEREEVSKRFRSMCDRRIQRLKELRQKAAGAGKVTSPTKGKTLMQSSVLKNARLAELHVAYGATASRPTAVAPVPPTNSVAEILSRDHNAPELSEPRFSEKNRDPADVSAGCSVKTYCMTPTAMVPGSPKSPQKKLSPARAIADHEETVDSDPDLVPSPKKSEFMSKSSISLGAASDSTELQLMRLKAEIARESEELEERRLQMEQRRERRRQEAKEKRKADTAKADMVVKEFVSRQRQRQDWKARRHEVIVQSDRQWIKQSTWRKQQLDKGSRVVPRRTRTMSSMRESLMSATSSPLPEFNRDLLEQVLAEHEGEAESKNTYYLHRPSSADEREDEEKINVNGKWYTLSYLRKLREKMDEAEDPGQALTLMGNPGGATGDQEQPKSPPGSFSSHDFAQRHFAKLESKLEKHLRFMGPLTEAELEDAPELAGAGAGAPGMRAGSPISPSRPSSRGSTRTTTTTLGHPTPSPALTRQSSKKKKAKQKKPVVEEESFCPIAKEVEVRLRFLEKRAVDMDNFRPTLQMPRSRSVSPSALRRAPTPASPTKVLAIEGRVGSVTPDDRSAAGTPPKNVKKARRRNSNPGPEGRGSCPKQPILLRSSMSMHQLR
eukprot:Rmarinus@m.6993